MGETEPFFKISAETILFLEQSSKVKLFSLQSEQDGAMWRIAGCPQWRGPCSDVWKDWKFAGVMLSPEACSKVVWGCSEVVQPLPAPGFHEPGDTNPLTVTTRLCPRFPLQMLSPSGHWQWPLTPPAAPGPCHPPDTRLGLGSRQDTGQTGTPMIHSSVAPGEGWSRQKMPEGEMMTAWLSSLSCFLLTGRRR